MTALSWFFLFAAIYASVLLLIAFLARGGRAESANDRLADYWQSSTRPFNLLVLVFTFSATLMSAFFVVGMPGFGYTHGAILWPYVIFGDVIGLLALYVVGHRVIQLKILAEDDSETKILSPLELIAPNRFGRIVILAITSMFVVPYLGVQISGFGRLIVETTEGGVSFLVASSATMLLLWTYSSISGIRAVAYSDLIQGILLLAVALSVSFFFVFESFGSVQNLIDAVQRERPELLVAPGGVGFGTYPVLFSSMIMFAALFVTQPQFLTRLVMIGSKNPQRKLRKMVVGLGIALAIFTVPILFLALGGAVVYPELSGGDKLMGTILSDKLPLWASMAVSVGVLAAAMSTADSILFSVSQMLTKDVLIDTLRLKVDAASSIAIGRIALLFLAIAALIIGVTSNTLIVQLAGLGFAGCLQVVPAVVGGLWNRNGFAYSGSISAIAGVGSLFYLGNSPSPATLGFHPAIPALILAVIVYGICEIAYAPFRRRPVSGELVEE